MALIEVKNLEKHFGDIEIPTVALCGVSFDIKEGEFVAIMGPSGSGKSTLLHILGYLDRPTGGTYKFENKIMKDLSDAELAHARNKKMGFIFQTFNLLARTNVFDNVLLPLQYSDEKEKNHKKMVEEAIATVGLNHRIYHDASRLSGGERQRVAIARAIVNNPKIIFADEPTGNLDSKSGQAVMEAIQDLNEKGRTVILVTHETYTAEYAERIIKLKDGLIESDTVVAKRHRVGKDVFKK